MVLFSSGVKSIFYFILFYFKLIVAKRCGKNAELVFFFSFWMGGEGSGAMHGL